ncbi:MAG: hypothetical protein AUG44_03435 [Actinobacteria bacterium 13_1_20CM_3_71_11]|nr:MAG: hypothetical protein AUG44_03435 [Actinobacteria bacterium 13_1_20CM_3_71_11]
MPQRFPIRNNVILDANGGGRIDVYPRADADLIIASATVSVTPPAGTANPKQPTADLYLNGDGQVARLDGTYTGSKDTAYNLGVLTTGGNLTCIWTGGDPGALATLSLMVVQYSRGRAPPSPGYYPFSNSVVGGNVLVRDAINSPNYVTGLSGWSIMRSGAAEFSDATIRGSLRVNGASNSWASLKTVSGVPELVFHPADVGAHVFTEGVVLGFANPPDGTPSTQIFSPTVDGLDDAKVFVVGKDGAGGVSQVFTQSVQVKFMAVGGFTDGIIALPADNSIRPYLGAVAEDWHTINPGNGWGNAVGFAPCKYRLISSPAKTVEVCGNIFGGTTTAGTNLFTLPVGYRPATKQRRAGFGSPTAGVPLVDIDTDGTCKLVNSWAGVVTVGIHWLISLDA